MHTEPMLLNNSQCTNSVKGTGMKYANEADFDKANVFGKGGLNDFCAEYFTGVSYLKPLRSEVQPGEPRGFNVTFEPGCRNNWHIHHAKSGGGQILVCTAGEGWYQAEGEPAISLAEGSFVFIPAGVKHWHGAKADSWFSHVAIEVPGEETSNEWLEVVSDEHYASLA